MPKQQHCQPIPTSLGQVYACLVVTCHLHFRQNDRGILRAAAVTGGGTDPNKSQHTTLTLVKKILPQLCQDSNSQPFDHESGALPTIPAPK